MKYHSDNYNHGFDKAAIFKVLSKYNINLDDENNNSVDDPLGWAYLLRAAGTFSGYQAACILCNLDPYGNYSKEAYPQIDAALLVISSNDLGLNSLILENEYEEDPKYRQYKHSDLRAFAKRAGYSWPIPEIKAEADSEYQAHDNSALLERLSELEAENKRLKHELELREAIDIEPEDRTEYVDAGFMAMRYAIKSLESGAKGKAKQMMLEYLEKEYPEIENKSRLAIALVFNFDRLSTPYTKPGAIAKYLKKK